MKIIAILILICITQAPLLAELPSEEGTTEYQELAWHQYQAGRICFEKYDAEVIQSGFEKCLKLQNTCKLIYDGIAADEKRSWLIQSPEVKKYLTDTGLKQLNYLHLLRLISNAHATPKK